MRSLRAQLTFALITTSFVAVAAVGLTARLLIAHRLDDLVVNRAAMGFSSEAGAYYAAYGSWEAATRAEPFFEFVARTRPMTFESGQGPRDTVDRGPPRRAFSFGGAPPPFAVTDAQGRALLPLGVGEVGAPVDRALLRDAIPILVDGAQVGLAVPLQRPALTEAEERYLAAVNDSWLLALLLAITLAVPIGFLWGNRFAAPIHEITLAMAEMEAGDLRQVVTARRNDEIGHLTTAFNAMSRRLATTYGQLEVSRETLTRQAEQLEELSRRDPLTGLLNRRAFDERVEALFGQARRYDRPMTLALADVDRFKRVNDEHSHAIGDAVLRAVATLIERNTRDIDVVGRYGGEEFAIAFAETDLQGAARYADRLRELVAEHDWSTISPGLGVTLSVGLCQHRGEASFEEVLGAADRKLYEAKAAGRNQVCA